MQNEYPVHIDSKGYVLIPAEVRKSLGLSPKSLLILSEEKGEIRLVPGEVVPRRKVRMVPREELAQALLDGAISAEGLKDAEEAIRELGLDPAQFKPRS